MGIVCCKEAKENPASKEKNLFVATAGEDDNSTTITSDAAVSSSVVMETTTTTTTEPCCSLGDISYPTTNNNSNNTNPEIFCSVKEAPNPKIPQPVQFVIEVPYYYSSQAEDKKEEEEAIVICYVGPQGTLHHYYTYSNTTSTGSTNMQINRIQHIEQSFNGDAFVVYKQKSKTTGEEIARPTTVQELANFCYNNNKNEQQQSCVYDLLCSYRLSPTNTVGKNQIHKIWIEQQQQQQSITKDDSGVRSRSLDSSDQTSNNNNNNNCFMTNVIVTESHKPDDEYRVIIQPPKVDETKLRAGIYLPPYTESWKVSYQYVCPPLPHQLNTCQDTTTNTYFNKSNQVFYVWGDMDFDDYGPNAKRDRPTKAKQLHTCKYNQIVPQIMIGECLCRHDPETFEPHWECFDEWVLQAQYYWNDTEAGSKAYCGKLITGIQPGDVIGTEIQYNATSGHILVRIAVLEPYQDSDDSDDEEIEYVRDNKRTSKIMIDRPFLHKPSLFQDWKDFFRQCQEIEEELLEETEANDEESKKYLRGSQTEQPTKVGPLCKPELNVEYKGTVTMEAMKAVCPFKIQHIQFPGQEPETQWKTTLFCPRLGRVDNLEGLKVNDSATFD